MPLILHIDNLLLLDKVLIVVGGSNHDEVVQRTCKHLLLIEAKIDAKNKIQQTSESSKVPQFDGIKLYETFNLAWSGSRCH